jgi:hypothetical protein
VSAGAGPFASAGVINQFECTAHNRKVRVSSPRETILQNRRVNIYVCHPRTQGLANCLTVITYSGNSKFIVSQIFCYTVGIYNITFATHPNRSNYIANATACAVQCGIWGDAGNTPPDTLVVIFPRFADSNMNIIV